MPQGGVEPPVARFLRPPRFPFRHCGHVHVRSASADARPQSVQCSAQDSNLHSLSGTGTSSPCVCRFRQQSMSRFSAFPSRPLAPVPSAHAALSITFAAPSAKSRQRRGKGSNLHPPASETGAESASASATNFAHSAPSRIRTCTRLTGGASEAPASAGSAIGANVFSRNTLHAPSRTRTCNSPVKSRRLCR